MLCQISFDRLQPDQIDPADESLYAELFGDSQYFPPEAQGTVAWLKGARMGGSYLCALRLLHLALITPLNLAPGEEAFAVMVAPDKKTAAQPYRFICGLIEETPHLRALIVGELGRENFVLQRPDGSRIRFEVLAASAGGSSLRGRSYVGVLLDESSFFRDSDSGVINDLELYRAVAPRIVTGGQLMIISTAWARTGLLWELIEKNLGHPVTCIAAEAHRLLAGLPKQTSESMQKCVIRTRTTPNANSIAWGWLSVRRTSLIGTVLINALISHCPWCRYR